MIDTEIRVTAKAEYPVCYTCLYCGAENRDTLRYEATRVETVRYTHNRHYQEEINEKKSQLQSEMYASFEKGVDLERRQVEGVAAFWEACQGEDMPSSPMITLRLPDKEYCCHQCFKVQPYAASYSTPLQTVSAISGVVTLFSALCGLMFFVISFGRDEQLFLTLFEQFLSVGLELLDTGTHGLEVALFGLADELGELVTLGHVFIDFGLVLVSHSFHLFLGILNIFLELGHGGVATRHNFHEFVGVDVSEFDVFLSHSAAAKCQQGYQYYDKSFLHVVLYVIMFLLIIFLLIMKCQ